MKAYAEMTREELLAEREEVQALYDALKARGLKLDMARGKPGTAQLDMTSEMMDILRPDRDYDNRGNHSGRGISVGDRLVFS